MLKLLANENVATDVVMALRANGHDVVWMKEVGPGSVDEDVLALARAENRVLLTFDKDFGELAFRRGMLATPGVILFRPRLRSPDYLVRFVQAVLAQGHHWEGHFAVAEEGRLRIVRFRILEPLTKRLNARRPLEKPGHRHLLPGPLRPGGG